VRRYGPGIPADPVAATPGPTAEQVWRTGLPAGRHPRLRRVWRVASTTLSVVLLAASGVLIYQRLHHPRLGVTGMAIVSQFKSGCIVDVTGRIDTNGGAGTVSYQWLFSPQLAAPRPLSQPVTGGQSAVYVTAAIQGQGHGNRSQQVILQILGPGRGTASTKVIINC
jgi:hypothetical protein